MMFKNCQKNKHYDIDDQAIKTMLVKAYKDVKPPEALKKRIIEDIEKFSDESGCVK